MSNEYLNYDTMKLQVTIIISHVILIHFNTSDGTSLANAFWIQNNIIGFYITITFISESIAMLFRWIDRLMNKVRLNDCHENVL